MNLEDPIKYHYPNNVLIEVWTKQRHIRTTFSDGTNVPASPQDTDGYRKTARECGYGGDDPCWDLCRDHELAHTHLAGREVSLTLWLVAHGVARVSSALAHPTIWQEEANVLQYQTRLSQQIPRPWELYREYESHLDIAGRKRDLI